MKERTNTAVRASGKGASSPACDSCWSCLSEIFAAFRWVSGCRFFVTVLLLRYFPAVLLTMHAGFARSVSLVLRIRWLSCCFRGQTAELLRKLLWEFFGNYKNKGNLQNRVLARYRSVRSVRFLHGPQEYIFLSDSGERAAAQKKRFSRNGSFVCCFCISQSRKRQRQKRLSGTRRQLAMFGPLRITCC